MKLNITDSIVSPGPNNIIGRALVVHQNQDDFGSGRSADSSTREMPENVSRAESSRLEHRYLVQMHIILEDIAQLSRLRTHLIARRTQKFLRLYIYQTNRSAPQNDFKLCGSLASINKTP